MISISSEALWDDKMRRIKRAVQAVSTSEGSTLVEEENTPFDLQD